MLWGTSFCCHARIPAVNSTKLLSDVVSDWVGGVGGNISEGQDSSSVAHCMPTEFVKVFAFGEMDWKQVERVTARFISGFKLLLGFVVSLSALSFHL